ncbi:MAG TPA: energy transducer TonB [Thermoanaerobaculia bacterium]
MTKTVAVFVAALCCAGVFAEEPSGYTVGVRSKQYSMTIDVRPLASGQVTYDIHVIDVATNSNAADAALSGFGDAQLETTVDNNGLRFRIRIAPRLPSLGAELSVEKDGTVIDSVRVFWNPQPPHPAAVHLVAPNARHVGGDVKAPVLIKHVEPLYPEEARRARIAGVVVVEALVDKSGAVRDAIVLKPLPYGLSESALDAVKQWQFEPSRLNGEPIDVIFNVTVNFKVQ